MAQQACRCRLYLIVRTTPISASGSPRATPLCMLQSDNDRCANKGGTVEINLEKAVCQHELDSEGCSPIKTH
jgi:hypothetical protein